VGGVERRGAAERCRRLLPRPVRYDRDNSAHSSLSELFRWPPVLPGQAARRSMRLVCARMPVLDRDGGKSHRRAGHVEASEMWLRILSTIQMTNAALPRRSNRQSRKISAGLSRSS